MTCKKCNKEFKNANNMKYHIDNKVCVSKKNSCKHCGSKFVSKISMYRHIRTACKIKKSEDEKKTNENEKNKEINDLLLEKKIKVEEEKIIVEELELQVKKLRLMEEKKTIEMRIKKLDSNMHTEKSPKNKPKSTNNYNNNIVINNVENVNNVVNNNNVVLIAANKVDMSKIEKNDLLKSIQGYYTPIGLTEATHFNPKYPEYHNIYISNMKNNYAMEYNGKEWNLVLKNDLIDKLYDDKKNYIEENLNDIKETLSKNKIAALERWLNDDEHLEKIKEVKQKLKLLLYNKKHIPLKINNNTITNNEQQINDTNNNKCTNISNDFSSDVDSDVSTDVSNDVNNDISSDVSIEDGSK